MWRFHEYYIGDCCFKCSNQGWDTKVVYSSQSEDYSFTLIDHVGPSDRANYQPSVVFTGFV